MHINHISVARLTRSSKLLDSFFHYSTFNRRFMASSTTTTTALPPFEVDKLPSDTNALKSIGCVLGSFDPLHNGHVMLVDELFSRGCDQGLYYWLIVDIC